MRLIPISSQARSNFAETFRRIAASDPRLMRRCSMIADLIEHLESNVIGPDTYAFKSMDELVMNDKNTDKRLVTINVGVNKWCVPDGYEIAYRTAPPWFYTIGYAESVEDATVLVLEALRLAVRDEENR